MTGRPSTDLRKSLGVFFAGAPDEAAAAAPAPRPRDIANGKRGKAGAGEGGGARRTRETDECDASGFCAGAASEISSDRLARLSALLLVPVERCVGLRERTEALSQRSACVCVGRGDGSEARRG